MLNFLFAFIATAIVLTLISASIYMGFVAARSNGWSELAKRYRQSGPAPRPRLHFQSAMLNEYAFPGTMQMAVTEQGLWLKPFLLLFHPPLLIPWDLLEGHRLEGRFTGLRLEADSIRFTLDIGESTRASLLEAAGPSTPARAVLLDEIPIARPGSR